MKHRISVQTSNHLNKQNLKCKVEEIYYCRSEMSPIIDNGTKMQFKSQLRVEHQTRNTLDNMAVANKKRNTWSPLLRAIECPACLELLTGNIQICRNGHSLCSKCRNAVQFCPLCRGLFTKMRNYTLEALVALFEYPCKYAEEGCETYLKKAEIADHQRNCVYVLINFSKVVFYLLANNSVIGRIAV